MTVLVSRKAPTSPKIPKREVQDMAEAMLAAVGAPHCELSVLLTNDRTIHVLNRKHRGKDKPTDVLSFPQLQARDAYLRKLRKALEGRAAKSPSARRSAAAVAKVSTETSANAAPALGDVVISLDTATEQARRRAQSLAAEVRFLLAHGILHLVGYDHGTDAEEARMDALTRHLVSLSR